MKIIRAFIAIPIPQKVQTFLSKTTNHLSAGIPNRAVRWVKPELMHLTLRFLGDTAETKVGELAESLDQVDAKHKSFNLQLDSLGSFPNFKRPRVIWVGLQGQLNDANKLKTDIDFALERLGWEKEDRPFRPHLTLGRVKDSRKIAGVLWEAHIEPLMIPVDSFHLVQSDLTPQGPIYTIRQTSKLQK